jgi:hypothetical protein
MINVLLEMGIEGEVKPAGKQTEKRKGKMLPVQTAEPITGKK